MTTEVKPTDETHGYHFRESKQLYNGVTVHRVIYAGNLKGGWVEGPYNVGGWIQSTRNLVPGGRVLDDAIVHGNAVISEYATVAGNAEVKGNAKVCEFATVFENATVGDNATICGHARVFGNAYVYGYTVVGGIADVAKNAFHAGYKMIGTKPR